MGCFRPQRLVHVHVALGDLVLKAIHYQPCLDAPMAGLGRYPDHAAYGLTAGRHLHVGLTHRCKGQTDAKIRHAELDRRGEGIGGVVIGHHGAQLGRVTGDGGLRVNRERPVGVWGPGPRKKGHRGGLGGKRAVFGIKIGLGDWLC